MKDLFGLVGTTLEGRFAIDRVVARGGFGVVYQGRHISLEKTIAVKVLTVPADFSTQDRRIFLDGFAQEARTIAQLDHPAIVRVLDFGVSRVRDAQELPWMVLEWVEGVSLADHLRKRRGQPMSPSDALWVLRPVFQALAFAHEHHIVHRDVKPSNIMLLANQRGVQVGVVGTKLLDFGIAKVMSPGESVGTGATHTHALMSAFSLPYASPEQKEGMKTGPWTDVHALGLILTELLTGHAPYPGSDKLEVGHRITAPVRPTPALFGVDVGPWEPLIAKAAALRSNERFQDAGRFLVALEAEVPEMASVSGSATEATEPMRAPLQPAAPHAENVPPTEAVPGMSPATITRSPTISTVNRDATNPNRRRITTAAGAGALVAVLAVAAVWSAVRPRSALPVPASALAARAQEPPRSRRQPQSPVAEPLNAISDASVQAGGWPDVPRLVSQTATPRSSRPQPSSQPRPGVRPAPGSQGQAASTPTQSGLQLPSPDEYH